MIQNQSGRFPTKWDKSGVVVEIKPNDQYVVKVAGSGRLTLRNRRFLRCYNSTHIRVAPSGFVPPPPVAHTVSSPHGDVVPQLPLIQDDVPSHLHTPMSVRRADNEDNSASVPRSSGSSTPLRRVSRTLGRTLFGDITPEEAAPPAASTPVNLPPPARPSLARTQRKVYDPSTGAYTEPKAVPEHV